MRRRCSQPVRFRGTTLLCLCPFMTEKKCEYLLDVSLCVFCVPYGIVYGCLCVYLVQECVCVLVVTNSTWRQQHSASLIIGFCVYCNGQVLFQFRPLLRWDARFNKTVIFKRPPGDVVCSRNTVLAGCEYRSKSFRTDISVVCADSPLLLFRVCKTSFPICKREIPVGYLSKWALY